MSDKTFISLSTALSNYHAEKLQYHSSDRGLPLSRLIAFAVDNELAKEKPFANFPRSIPDEEHEEYAYADQAGKILQFLKGTGGLSLDMLIVLRHDIGVPDISDFLAAFKECIDKKFVEAYTPHRAGRYFETKNNYVYYRLKGKAPLAERRKRREASEYAKHLKLKAKYEGK